MNISQVFVLLDEAVGKPKYLNLLVKLIFILTLISDDTPLKEKEL
jgi:hypothetical protein